METGELVEKGSIVKLSKRWGLRPWQRHSLMLLIAGFVYSGVGLVYILTIPTVGRQEALAIATHVMPLEEWGDIFLLVGVLAVISSRWPEFAYSWGYMVLTGLSAGWSAVYALGIIMNGTSNSNITISLIWGLLAFMWWFIAGLTHPNHAAVISNGSP